MRGEAFARGKKADEITRDVERFDRADAQALNGSFVQNLLQQLQKFHLRRKITAVCAQVNATEHNFAESGIRQALKLGNNRCRGKAARAATHEWNHAERTARIASVLNLQRRSSVIPFPTEDWRNQNIGEI